MTSSSSYKQEKMKKMLSFGLLNLISFDSRRKFLIRSAGLVPWGAALRVWETFFLNRMKWDLRRKFRPYCYPVCAHTYLILPRGALRSLEGKIGPSWFQQKRLQQFFSNLVCKVIFWRSFFLWRHKKIKIYCDVIMRGWKWGHFFPLIAPSRMIP